MTDDLARRLVVAVELMEQRLEEYAKREDRWLDIAQKQVYYLQRIAARIDAKPAEVFRPQ